MWVEGSIDERDLIGTPGIARFHILPLIETIQSNHLPNLIFYIFRTAATFGVGEPIN